MRLPDERAADRVVPRSRGGVAERTLAGVLRIHPRRRFQLLEEISADVDALEESLVARGISRDRARAAALDRMLPDAGVARELEEGRVAYRRLEARFGADRLVIAERAGLAAIAGLTLIPLVTGLVRLDAFRAAGPFVWALVVTVAAIVANTGRLAFGLWVRQDLTAAARRRAWRLQVGLVLVAVSVAGAGVGLVAWNAADLLAADPDPITGWAMVGDVMGLASLGLGAVALGLIGWIVLTPSLRSYDTFERRIAALFAPPDRSGRLTLHRSATEE